MTHVCNPIKTPQLGPEKRSFVEDIRPTQWNGEYWAWVVKWIWERPGHKIMVYEWYRGRRAFDWAMRVHQARGDNWYEGGLQIIAQLEAMRCSATA